MIKVTTTDAYMIEEHSTWLEGKIDLSYGIHNVMGVVSAHAYMPIGKIYRYHGIWLICKKAPNPKTFNTFLLGAEDCIARGFEYGETIEYGFYVNEDGSFGTGFYNMQITY